MNNIIYSIFIILIIHLTAQSEVLYRLFIQIDTEKHLIKGKADIINSTDKSLFLNLKTFKNSLKKETLLIKPEETVYFSFEKKFPSYSANSMIGKDFVYLMNNWYPQIDSTAYYSLTVKIPKGFKGVSESEKVHEEIKGREKIIHFYIKKPLEGIHFIASKDYYVKSLPLGEKKIYVYLFKEDGDLADLYLKKSYEYIKRYERIIGEFPYKRFSIVENRFPTGYSMPTFTLIGRQILRYPFILKSSLPHEIVHQWFGCSVYVDMKNGNWSEGLTTYLSDHMLSENPVMYRKNILLKYMAYVDKDNEYPLKKFLFKRNKVDEAIGYGKGAMVFHMLRRYLGDRYFFQSLNAFYKDYRFKKASWIDIKNTFEKVSGKNLNSFFVQWVDRKGIPVIDIKNAFSFINKDGHFQIDLSLDISRTYRLDIPVEISSYYKKYIFSAKKEKNRFIVEDIPLFLTLDRDYDLFRTLTEKEMTPVIHFLLGEKKPLIILKKEDTEKFKPVISYYREKDILYSDKFMYKKLQGRTVLILGKGNPVLKKIFGKTEKNRDFLVKGYKNPFSEKKCIFVISKKGAEKFHLLKHYGNYTEVPSKHTKNIENGIRVILNEPSTVQTEKGIKNFNQMLKDISTKNVIYIGENHKSFSNHAIQYQIIKGLREHGKDIAIGMEMFGRKYQKYIDEYIQERISEDEFLKKTHYFRQWRYDYHFYRPILRYARKYHIPVIGLNIDQKIIEKVARKGIDSLSEEEKRLLPESIDFTNLKYKDFLFRIYSMHAHGDIKNFQNFYQSQLLWDETMAETAADYIKAHPDKILVVLAGNGHLMYGYGIPDRVKRRVLVSQSIILQDEQLEKGKGDFFIFNERVEGVLSKKLGVYVEEKEKGLEVDSVIKTSIAEKAGIRKGDIIISFNGKPVKTVEDLKILLIDPPDISVITVLRGNKKVNLQVDFKNNANHLQK